jgi:hypothetical protein
MKRFWKLLKLSNVIRSLDRRFYQKNLDGMRLRRFHAKLAGRWMSFHYRASDKSSDYAIVKLVFVRKDDWFGRGLHASAINSCVKAQSRQPLILMPVAMSAQVRFIR